MVTMACTKLEHKVTSITSSRGFFINVGLLPTLHILRLYVKIKSSKDSPLLFVFELPHRSRWALASQSIPTAMATRSSSLNVFRKKKFRLFLINIHALQIPVA